ARVPQQGKAPREPFCVYWGNVHGRVGGSIVRRMLGWNRARLTMPYGLLNLLLGERVVYGL
ncbi:hypothetical protein CERSUDRAFT_84204, partial [Gelatoporia subvermispora B]